MAHTPPDTEANFTRPDPASFRDPSGTLCWHSGRIERHIQPAVAPFFRELTQSATFNQWVTSGLIVPTWIERDDDTGLVLGHETITPITYPHEWPTALFYDAASLVLQVAEVSAHEGFGLADGHPWNVLIHRGRPVFIDVGSLGPEPSDLLWPAHQQYLAFCLYPLHLYRANLPELAAAQLADLSLGISDELALRALPLGYKLTNPMLWGSLLLRRLLALRLRSSQKKQPTPRPHPANLRQIRRLFFSRLHRELQRLKPQPVASSWSHYYQTCPGMSEEEQQTKLRAVERFLDAWQPPTVLDLGCNTGAYACLAARKGAAVIAVDQDEVALSQLYRQARQENLNLLPLHINLCNPSAGSGWNGAERAGTWKRLSGDTTLMLALLHHLLITHQVTIEHVAELATRVTKKRVLIEWVDLNDPMAQVLCATSRRQFPDYEPSLLVQSLNLRGFHLTDEVPVTSTRRILSFERA